MLGFSPLAASPIAALNDPLIVAQPAVAVGAIGTVVVIGDAIILPAGVAADVVIDDDFLVSGAALVLPAGVAADVVIDGDSLVSGTALVIPAGVAADGDIGSPTVTGSAVVLPAGVAADVVIDGDSSVSGTALVIPAGVVADVPLGEAVASISSRVIPTPVRAFSQLGEVEVKINAPVPVIGLSANGAVGQLLVWQKIDDSQNPPDPNWLPVILD